MTPYVRSDIKLHHVTSDVFDWRIDDSNERVQGGALAAGGTIFFDPKPTLVGSIFNPTADL